ncbi:MAG: ATP-dependent Clp protease proteolytic subunit [Bacilli bacterium]|nr:ATP-dependent Clp protease proteolytic subunit [Bacilli bacterium]
MSWDGNNMSLSKDSPRNYMYKNTVYILDEISEKSCAYLIGDLYDYVTNPQNFDTPLNFIINSPGGDVYVMMTIIGLINIAKLNKIQINTYVMGIAASAASVIAIQGDVRKITNVSRHFIHFGSMWSLTERHSEIEKIYEQTKDYAERIDNLYLQSCPGLTAEKLRSLQLDERGYLNAEQCIEYGLCDSIIEDDLAKMNKLHDDADNFEELFEDYTNGKYKNVMKKLEALSKKESKRKAK